MIVDPNVSSFVDSLYKDGDDFMEALRLSAEEENVPIIRRQTEGFLKSLLLLKRPRNILEIGTGVAYSSIFMAKTLPGVQITTIENYPPRIQRAKENISAADLSGRIHIIEEDAAAVLPELSEPFDFIFLDGPKGQYISFLADLIRLLDKDSVLLTDNVLQDGDIAFSRYVHERRQRTIHKRLRDFLYEITHCDELETSILTIGDGLSLSIKL